MTSIFIFRRDLRINDNTALIEAVKNSDTIYPIFILTPEQTGSRNLFKSPRAVNFMLESLKEVNKKLNNKLSVFKGKYLDILKKIIKEYPKIDAIYTNTDYSPYAIKRDLEIETFCEKEDIDFYPSHDVCIFTPGTIKNQSGKVYKKFTPFYNLCLSQTFPKVQSLTSKKVQNISKSLSKLKKDHVNLITKTEDHPEIMIGGRSNGLKLLTALKNHKKYDDNRNSLSTETTRLSAYLKFGCISIREAYHRMLDLFGKKHPLIRQLIWRDFYYHVGANTSNSIKKRESMKQKYDQIKWKGKWSTYKSWMKGETGFPIVDACMRQLNFTGYMHNRGRLIAGSFLIKNLHHDWRKGEQYFSNKLLDIDWLVNNGNWQWLSGGGTDSQPYFRIFNPWTQSSKHDPDAEYIKKWIPELEDVPPKHLHQWDQHYQKYTDLDYPGPVIDYVESRKTAIDMYKEALG